MNKDLTIACEMVRSEYPGREGTCSHFRLHGRHPRVPGIEGSLYLILGGGDASRREVVRSVGVLMRGADLDSRCLRVWGASLRKHG